jgi:nucleoside-diphosphate-sugar epimerase
MNITILGANGIVGQTLTEELKKQKVATKLRLVAREYQNKTEDNVEYLATDLLDENATAMAVTGSDLVYLTVGLPYRTAVWKKDWPIVIRHVLSACQKNNSKLVWFDNVYAYGQVSDNMTEETLLQPSSEKGMLRKQLQEMIFEAIEKKQVTAVIAKSADYYGPSARLSLFYINNIENILKGKKPFWMGDPSKKHSFTYLPDAAKALVELGLSEMANNQVWHLPTAKPLTGNDYMRIITEAMSVPNKFAKLNKFMLRLAGVFNSDAKELVEMFYQFDRDYIFDSTKFENVFTTRPTSYEDGIKIMVQSFKLINKEQE